MQHGILRAGAGSRHESFEFAAHFGRRVVVGILLAAAEPPLQGDDAELALLGKRLPQNDLVMGPTAAAVQGDDPATGLAWRPPDQRDTAAIARAFDARTEALSFRHTARVGRGPGKEFLAVPGRHARPLGENRTGSHGNQEQQIAHIGQE